jgi:hypothetical protein
MPEQPALSRIQATEPATEPAPEPAPAVERPVPLYVLRERVQGLGRRVVTEDLPEDATAALAAELDAARLALSLAEADHGLGVGILRPTDLPDCSLGGVSSRYTRGVIVGVRTQGAARGALVRPAVQRGLAALPRLSRVGDAACGLELVVRQLQGDGVYVHAEPTEGCGRWAMSGGCYVVTSDSRFAELLGAIYGDGRSQVGPVPLHDRYETGR